MRVLLRICWSWESPFFSGDAIISFGVMKQRKGSREASKFLQWPKNREIVKVKRTGEGGAQEMLNHNACYVCISKNFTFRLYPQKSWPLWSALVILVVRYIDRTLRVCWPGGLASLASLRSYWEAWHCLRNRVSSSSAMTPKVAFAFIQTHIQNTPK